ncbi:hypothetical protein MTsN3n11_10980 [Qipengyuania sp. MTN3-11]
MAALLYASRLPGVPYEIALVASNDPGADALDLAAGEGLPTFALAHRGMTRAEHDRAMGDAAKEAGADYIVLAGYMRILTPEFVARWQGRVLNIHPSLLPAYPGLDTHARAIAAGDRAGGCSVHLVTDELDSGEVLGQLAVAISPEDTAEALAARVKLAEHQLYPRVLADYVSRPYRADWLLAEVRSRAMALDEVEEKESHGAPGWKLAGKSGKFFAYFSDFHHGGSNIALLVKTSGADEQEAVIARDSDRVFSPPYYGSGGWIGIVLDRPGLDWEQVEYWLARSWRAVAPRRLSRLLDAAEEF